VYHLIINGRQMSIDVPDDTPLLWAIRDFFGLTGTKYGCGIGQCGACTVTVDGQPQRSCILTVVAAQNKDVRTIEVLSEDSIGARVQAAWLKLNVIQCGYCQSGQLISATALLTKYPKPSDTQIDDAMSGNICRCGTYVRIRAAIHEAAAS
jgi:isoquinoline 1-oxidoreductase alpha subunit